MRALTAILILQAASVYAQTDPDELIHYRILPHDTDPLISAFASDVHQAFYNPTSQPQHTLLVHLVGSGDTTGSTTFFPVLAANNGFHCINLDYRNGVSVQSACADIPDTTCHLNWRKEVIEGIDYSAEIFVNEANSIYNRLFRLLQYLDIHEPTQNWGQFLSGGSIQWDHIIISGHSQGGGHAAVIGISNPVRRVLMFASPNDHIDTLHINAPWSKLLHLAADSDYYSFNAVHDEIADYWKQYEHSQSLGQGAYGDTVPADDASYPYGHSRQLYTLQVAPSGFPIKLTHDIMIRDFETPVDIYGKPVFACVWLYMLGINCDPLVAMTDIPSVQPERQLLRILDLLGRETEFQPNEILIYQFSDGSTEKKIIIQ
ncbi:MAG TPA: hypothetical protein DCG24_10775 [Bacteroidetes bacterium]|nr:hypothetical protein [Bacteroidota bacterium]